MDRKVVLVTGGARGIGAGIARTLSHDYHVVVLDKLEPDSDVDVEFHQVDLMDVDAAREVLQRATTTHDVTRLVNNVGIVRPARAEDISHDRPCSRSRWRCLHPRQRRASADCRPDPHVDRHARRQAVRKQEVTRAISSVRDTHEIRT